VNWSVWIRHGTWIFGVLGFVFPPPLNYWLGAGPTVWRSFAVFLVACVIALTSLAKRSLLSKKPDRFWVLTSVMLLIISLASLAGYFYVLDHYTCSWLGGRAVVASESCLSARARAYIRNPVQRNVTCTDLLNDDSGIASELWDCPELLRNRFTLLGVYAFTVIALATFMSTLSNAVRPGGPRAGMSFARYVRPLPAESQLKAFGEVQTRAEGALEATTPRVSKRLRVFLCHASEDKVPVRNLLTKLRDWGHDPWLDEEKILPGQDWEREIRHAMQQAQIVLVCLSTRSEKRGYVQKELRRALDIADEQPEGTIFIVPVKLEPCSVPERLAKWQWVDLFSDGGEAKLRAALREVARPQNNENESAASS
jgi:hypothetical protein